MTRHDDHNHSDAQAQVDALDPALAGRFAEVLDLLVEQGFDGMAHAMQTLLNEAMKLERRGVLSFGPRTRHAKRTGVGHGGGRNAGTASSVVGKASRPARLRL